MSTPNTTGRNEYNAALMAEAIGSIVSGLEQTTSGLKSLKLLLAVAESGDGPDFDPKDPANKLEVGGVMKLTPRGTEICYRLFDAGKSRYAVAALMGISFGAATHRFNAWKELGGVNRRKQSL